MIILTLSVLTAIGALYGRTGVVLALFGIVVALTIGGVVVLSCFMVLSCFNS